MCKQAIPTICFHCGMVICGRVAKEHILNKRVSSGLCSTCARLYRLRKKIVKQIDKDKRNDALREKLRLVDMMIRNRYIKGNGEDYV